MQSYKIQKMSINKMMYRYRRLSLYASVLAVAGVLPPLSTASGYLLAQEERCDLEHAIQFYSPAHNPVVTEQMGFHIQQSGGSMDMNAMRAMNLT